MTLSQNGITITTRISQHTFYGSLFLVPGDNLASQFLGGYKSLASAHRKCRNCLATNENMQSKVRLYMMFMCMCDLFYGVVQHP